MNRSGFTKSKKVLCIQFWGFIFFPLILSAQLNISIGQIEVQNTTTYSNIVWDVGFAKMQIHILEYRLGCWICKLPLHGLPRTHLLPSRAFGVL